MHEDSKRWFRIATGRQWDDHVRQPSAADIVSRRIQEITSSGALRTLGWASDGEMLLSEEARESHIHILGAPGEGKSKFIEMLVEHDIKQGYGALVLDPSDNGDTVYKILKFCCKHGYEKVILVDPHDVNKFSRVATLNPIHYKAPANVCVGNIEDTIRILWGSKLGETAKIDKYLPAILRVLHGSESTLYDALYFTDRTHPVYRSRREKMMDALHPLDQTRVVLESAYSKSPTMFSAEMDSTFRRFQPFFDEVMRLFVGSNRNPLNFAKLVADGWVILVNLDSTGIWGDAQQRLLGTMVLNEVIYAIYRLRENGWKGKYYVYIDEVGDYATPKLAEVLDKRRKSGIRFTVAHQRFDQLEDKNVLSAVMGSTKIKVLFNVPNREDRDRMIRMMYGGDIPDRQVSYELGQLPKQEAAIKINKQPPRKTRLADVPDIEVDPKVFKAFKEKLLKHESFMSPKEVLEEINARFTQSESKHARQPTPARPAPDSRPQRNSKRTVEKQDVVKGKPKNTRGVRPPAVPDDSPSGANVLFKKTGRSTRKVPKVQP